CCEVGGGRGGGGVVGGVGVVCGDGVDRGVGGVDCGVVCGVKAPISAMIVRVPEKDRWCGTRGKFVRWKGVRVTKASKHAYVGVRGWCCEVGGGRGGGGVVGGVGVVCGDGVDRGVGGVDCGVVCGVVFGGVC
nr:hypothetical protein [Tanacetum cinerariifolium]